MIIPSIFNSIYEKQVDSVFLWLSSVALENDRILVDVPGKSGTYRFKFPLAVGDYPRRVIPKAVEQATFAIVSSRKLLEQKEKWVPLFSSKEFSVYEHRTRLAKLALRWGTSMTDRSALILLARKSLESSFSAGKNVSQEFPLELREKLGEKLSVGVALWVRGKLRGSMISTNKTVFEGVVEAAGRAAIDLRFKPITEADLNGLRIEITVFSPLRIPLTKQLITERRILPEKGYCLTFGGKIGWLLPEVFNVRQFRDLPELLEMLARKKAGLSTVDKNIIGSTFIFNVEDFIESAQHGKPPIVLHASMPEVSLLPAVDYLERARDAASWLCSIQEDDGNIPPIFDFSKVTHNEKVDWSRLGFAALALNVFGSFIGEGRFCTAAEKALRYFEQIFFSQSIDQKFPVSSAHMSVYAGQLAIQLGRTELAHRISEEIALRNISETVFSPIAYAQRARLFGGLSGSENELIYRGLLDVLRKNFLNENKENPVFDLASWASAVEVFWDVDREFAIQIARWIVSYQNPDGSFPTSPTNPKPYTRGTGKIAEVLALDLAWGKETERALLWLCSMQYNADTMFFVPLESHSLVSGSLRHDYLNWESWTDSVAHFIIAVTRMCRQKG